jgi:hypothetical protein
MASPSPHDWRFDEIAKSEPERAKLLETRIASDELTSRLAISIADAIKDRTARYGLDSKDEHPRIIIQVPILPALHDQFFNGRNGYRAHYWASPDTGNDFDSTLVRILRQAIKAHMPTTVDGRRIEVKKDNNGDREEEFDRGCCSITSEFALQSLTPEASKAWRCEWLITGRICRLRRQSLGTMDPKLIIASWEAHPDGLRAPRGEWLDFKGGFVDDKDLAKPSKNRNDRAKQINESGWT